jgi:hypothetical protein
MEAIFSERATAACQQAIYTAVSKLLNIGGMRCTMMCTSRKVRLIANSIFAVFNVTSAEALYPDLVVLNIVFKLLTYDFLH